MELWSNRPFISHDGGDDNGFRAEVRVSMGHGLIVEIEERERASNIIFDTGHKRYRLSGWMPHNDPLYPIVKEAYENKEAIYLRIETRRKPGIDRHTPIMELLETAEIANKSIYKALTGVKRDDEEEWHISPTALTNMAEDESARRGGVKSANSLNPEELNGANRKPITGGVGQLDPGSYAVAAPVSVYSFVCEEKPEYDEATKIKLTKLLLTICNNAQLKIYEGKLEKPNMGDYSHVRARQLVFAAFKHYSPLPEGAIEDNKALHEWANETLDKVVKLWQWSIRQVEETMK